MARFGEMLYTRLERLEAKLEIDLNFADLEMPCVTEHDISKVEEDISVHTGP